MGRPKCFSRKEVMERAIPVFWKHGFNGTSVQDLEKATAVNKSGLYSEFKDKEDLFLCSMKHYVQQTTALETLSAQPLGWSNIEAFLKKGQTCTGQKGCFLVNTARELRDLPAAAKHVITEHLEEVRDAIARNAKAAGCKNPGVTADLIMTYFSGLSVQQNFGLTAEVAGARIDQFLALLGRDIMSRSR